MTVSPSSVLATTAQKTGRITTVADSAGIILASYCLVECHCSAMFDFVVSGLLRARRREVQGEREPRQFHRRSVIGGQRYGRGRAGLGALDCHLARLKMDVVFFGFAHYGI